MDKKIQFVYLPIDSLVVYDKNARKHKTKDIAAIKNSIEEFGMNDPIGIWSDKNIIVEGHGRYLALKELGWKEVPCIRLDYLTDDQRKAYAIAHNRTAELSEWDMDNLVAELRDLEDKFELEKFGMDFQFVHETKEAEDDNFDYDKEIEKIEPFSKPGDVWKLGDHILMCGDSTKEEDVNKLLGGEDVLVDLMVTDPPYNVDYDANGTREGIENDAFEDVNDYTELITKAMINASNHLKGGATYYIFFAGRYLKQLVDSTEAAGFINPHMLIWKKDSLVLGRAPYQYNHEPFLFGKKDGGPYAWFSDRKQVTCMEFDRPKKSKYHPTQKPIPLFGYLISNSSKKDDIVLDLFGGSGTALIACEQLGRRCRMMEIDPKFVDTIVIRWELLTGKKAVKFND